MDGVHGFRFLWRQVEFFQNQLISLGVFLYPFSYGHFIGPVIHMVEHTAAWLVLVGTDERALATVLVSLLVELLFPDILVHFGAGDSPIRGVGFGVVTHPVGYDSEQLVRRSVVPEDTDLGFSVFSSVGGHLSHDGLLIPLGIGFQVDMLEGGFPCPDGDDCNGVFIEGINDDLTGGVCPLPEILYLLITEGILPFLPTREHPS